MEKNLSMESLNIDFTPNAYATTFLADTIILNYLKDINLIHDANMYVIYGSNFGMDVSNYTKEDLVELANIYSNEIDKFILSCIKYVVTEMMNKWTELALDKKSGVVFSVPEAGYASFKKFIHFAKHATIEYDDDMIDAIVESVKRAFTSLQGKSWESREMLIPINPQDVVSVINYLMRMSEDLYMSTDRGDIIKKRYNTAISNFVTYATTLIRMTNVQVGYSKQIFGNDMPFDNARLVFDATLSKNCYNFDKDTRYQIRKSRTLDLAHVFCLGTRWNDNLIVSEQPITCPTDSSRLMATMIIASNENTYFKKHN